MTHACALSPTENLLKKANRYGFQTHYFDTKGYQLVGFSSEKIRTDYLNIYFEGDGRPWINGRTIANNPTGKIPLALGLMNRDPYTSLYLNRPCYAFNPLPDNCDNTLWTSHRYSKTVIDTMNEAIDQAKAKFNTRYINLIGFSGGGTIAVLIAQKRDDIKNIVTIAANLNHKAWTEHFGYEPLIGSLNAADTFPLPSTIRRWHLTGENDAKVPPHIVSDAARHDTGAQLSLFPSFTHSCCWENVWEEFIRENIGNIN